MNFSKSEGLASKKTKTYKAQVNDVMLEFNKPNVSGSDLLLAAGEKNPECVSLYQKLKGCDFERITLNEIVDLSDPGLEKFVIKPPVAWNYTIDEEPETSTEPELSANQILDNAGIRPVTDYYLMEIDHAGNEISHQATPDALITLKCPGSKFVSVFKGETPVSQD